MIILWLGKICSHVFIAWLYIKFITRTYLLSLSGKIGESYVGPKKSHFTFCNCCCFSWACLSFFSFICCSVQDIWQFNWNRHSSSRNIKSKSKAAAVLKKYSDRPSRKEDIFHHHSVLTKIMEPLFLFINFTLILFILYNSRSLIRKKYAQMHRLQCRCMLLLTDRRTIWKSP